MSLVFMPKKPVTSVGGSRHAVRIESVNNRRFVTAIILASSSSSNRRARPCNEPTSWSIAIELLCQGADGTGYLRIMNCKPRLKAMKHAAKLGELPVYAHRLQADAPDALAFVVR